MLGGADIQNIQNDITTVVNGGITNSNINASAAIAESKVAFDISAGHDHDGSNSKTVAQQLQRASIWGAELVYVGADTLNAVSGTVDINGTVYERTAVSSTIDVSSDSDKVAGTANAASTWFYIYAYNDSGTSWDIKWWNLAPQYANCGTDTSGPLIFRQSGGAWYRCIGAVYNDSGQALDAWFQRGSLVMWDVPVNVTTTTSNGAWSSALSCSSAMPSTSELALFGGHGTRTAESTVYWFVRPNGSTWSSGVENSAIGWKEVGAQRWCATDSSQQIQYFTQDCDADWDLDVEGYVLNIR